IFLTKFADLLEKGSGCFPDTAYALDTFDNNGGYLLSLLLKAGFEGCLVIKGKEDDIIRLIDRGDDGRIVRHGHGQRCPSMKGLGEGDDLLPSIVKGGQL